jgi:large subunit ribosomal protein L19
VNDHVNRREFNRFTPGRERHRAKDQVRSVARQRSIFFRTSCASLEAKPNEKIPQLAPGDTVSVHVKIKEGDRERVQEFKGIVIRMRKGGNDANITVRRMASNGIGVERTFLLRSPRVDKVVVERHSQIRRAQLYFMRGRTGKSARLKQKFD